MGRYDDTGFDQLHPNERIKADSDYLRGTIVDGLADPVTGGIAESDGQLTKFHGTYQQDDRDLRDERRKQKLEPAYQFMVRVRCPGGVVTPDQWLALDTLAQRYGGNTFRLTTRQTFQFHWVLKRDLKSTIAGINDLLLDTVAACGDVNRNVLATNNPEQSHLHAEAYGWAKAISERLKPRTNAYYEIWLDKERVGGQGEEEEPLYGRTYLPRKFKAAVAVPPANDVDVYANDLGFIAVPDDAGGLAGFNVAVGGGMGMTYGETRTYPRLAEEIGFCTPDQVLDVAEAVVATQRDWGDREDRKRARLKYTIDTYGSTWFRQEIETRAGITLQAVRPVTFTDNGDRFGWLRGADGYWYYTLFLLSGRIADSDGGYQPMSGLRAIAQEHTGDFRVTANQNLIVGRIPESATDRIDTLLRQYGLEANAQASPLARNSIACVAMPTCGMAMAEAERYMPDLLEKLNGLIRAAGLGETAIKIRMSGCNNGCSRAYLGEIGFSGKAPGKYNLYLGAGWRGDRLSKLYRENIGEGEILAALQPILNDYATAGTAGEAFGDFCVRRGHVAEVVSAKDDFHA